jgi:hypothetical protein
MNPIRSAVVFGCLLAIGLAAEGRAQSSYPNVDRPFVLAAGDTVHMFNRIVVDRAPGQRGARIDIQYSTHIPPDDASARAAQADRLAQMIGSEASKIGARKVMLSICDTRACAETREQPRVWYSYERGLGGVWQRARGT